MAKKLATTTTTTTPVVKKITKSSKKETVSVAAPIAPEPTPIVEAKIEVATEEVDTIVQFKDNYEEQYSVFSKKLQIAITSLVALKNEFKVLEKRTTKELKAAKKITAKRARKGNRQPSGFVKPTLVTDELATFLGKPSGTEMARTEVTREINKYIRSNDLQDKDNGRKINPDAALSKLLRLKKEDELTYFNLQRYMSPHFPKPAVAAAAAGTSA